VERPKIPDDDASVIPHALNLSGIIDSVAHILDAPWLGSEQLFRAGHCSMIAANWYGPQLGKYLGLEAILSAGADSCIRARVEAVVALAEDAVGGLVRENVLLADLFRGQEAHQIEIDVGEEG
jgi:hypothetical protein